MELLQDSRARFDDSPINAKASDDSVSHTIKDLRTDHLRERIAELENWIRQKDVRIGALTDHRDALKNQLIELGQAPVKPRLLPSAEG